jgi:predicted ABC-type ATPase
MELPSVIPTLDINENVKIIHFPKLPMPHNIKYRAGCMLVMEDETSMQRSVYQVDDTRGVLHGIHDVGQDSTLLHTARRQCKEQIGYTPSSFAAQCIYSLDIDREAETTFLVISLTFIVLDKGPFEFEKSQHVVWKSAQQIYDDLSRCRHREFSKQLRTFCVGFRIWSQPRDQPSVFYNDFFGQFEQKW